MPLSPLVCVSVCVFLVGGRFTKINKKGERKTNTHHAFGFVFYFREDLKMIPILLAVCAGFFFFFFFFIVSDPPLL